MSKTNSKSSKKSSYHDSDDEKISKNSKETYIFNENMGEMEGMEYIWGEHEDEEESEERRHRDSRDEESSQIDVKPKVDPHKVAHDAEAPLEIPMEGVDIAAEEEEMQKETELKRFSESLGVIGIARINLSPLTQKILGCLIEENVTTEYPWVTVKKEIIEDNLDLHSESSDFLPIKNEIIEYPEPQMLLGYAPTVVNSNDFYICLTPESRKAVMESIENLRLLQQQRVLSAVKKTPKPWIHLGSAEIIKESFVEKTRPLFEVEIKSTIDQLKASTSLGDKKGESKRSTNVEVVPTRETFTNVNRILVTKASENIQKTKENEVQTEATMPVNAVCQCLLDQEAMTELENVNIKNLEKFIKKQQKEIFEQIEITSTWDMHKNDYTKLVLSNKTAVTAKGYIERQNLYNGQVTKGCLINDLSWHPEWTGVMAAAYTTISKSDYIVGPKPTEKINQHIGQVLVWSFDDCLKPKLILESVREVTAVSFCPTNGNFIIGGCCNGQIAIWDITGKIEEVEAIIIRTAAQVKYESLIKSLTGWMKDARSSSILKPTAMSCLQSSHKGPVTSIKWLTPFKSLDDRGILHDVPDDATEEELTKQFVTSSEDGSIAIWNLNWRPPEDTKKDKNTNKKKKKQPQPKPASLVQSISPLKVLDGIFKPLYMLIAQNPNETRNAIITAISIPRTSTTLHRIEPFFQSDDIIKRRYFKVDLNRDESMDSVRIFVGTARGYCGLLSWEGYEFSTGVTLNKEVCKWVWYKQIHDGPVSHISRSRHLNDLILTVGGRIFAIWCDQFEEPILWRKSEHRYTACCWDNSKPTVFILGRNDGTVETWDMFIKTHEPDIVESLSGRIITGIYAHKLPLNPQSIAFCDYNGALRIFLVPKVLFESKQSDVKWMRQFIDREVDRNRNFVAWKEDWLKRNASANNRKLNEENDKKLARIAAEKARLLEEEAKIEAARNAKRRERKTFIEKLQARWVTRELKRMQNVIFERKGLNEEELEKNREPLLRMKREARDKEAKRQYIVETADEFFMDVVGSNFPNYNKKLIAMEENSGDAISIETVPIGDYMREDEKIIEDYKKVETEALAMMRQTAHELDFSFRKLINEGLNRRRSIDVNMKPHKIKLNSIEESDKNNAENGRYLESIESLTNLSGEVPIAESSQII